MILKVIRYYASKENSINPRSVLQDLLASELERIIYQTEIDCNHSGKYEISREEIL